MKKFYCLYNKNNLPFSWKLKEANEKPIANFKTREDCLNHYLSFKNPGIIWFQKASVKKVSKENIQETFAGCIKSSSKNNELIHIIETSSSTPQNRARILKRNLYHALQIDPQTGIDLLEKNGIDRLFNNKNSYLIFDNDIAEEVMSVKDAQSLKISKKDIYDDSETTNDFDIDSSRKLTQDENQDTRNIHLEVTKPLEVTKELEVTKPLEVSNNEYENTNNNYINYVDDNNINDQININPDNENVQNSHMNDNNNNNYQTINKSNILEMPLNNFDSNRHAYYQNDNTQYLNYDSNNFNNKRNNLYANHWINHQDYGVNINDFNFLNDFENSRLQMQPLNQQEFFQNYSNNNDKIFKNNFYKINRYWEREDNMNKRNTQQFNNNGQNNVNDWQSMPMNNQQLQRPAYGTVEFTAVPNQMLNTDSNPLGGETMIFNPYSFQNQKDTVIQPIIQPIIQRVYQPQQPPQTIVLDPIINPAISSDYDQPIYPSYNNGYSDYQENYNNPYQGYTQNFPQPQMQYQQPMQQPQMQYQQPMQQPQMQKQTQQRTMQNKFVPQQQTSSQSFAPRKKHRDTSEFEFNNSSTASQTMTQPISSNVNQGRNQMNTMDVKLNQEKQKNKKLLYSFVVISAILMAGIVVVIGLMLGMPGLIIPK